MSNILLVVFCCVLVGIGVFLDEGCKKQERKERTERKAQFENRIRGVAYDLEELEEKLGTVGGLGDADRAELLRSAGDLRISYEAVVELFRAVMDDVRDEGEDHILELWTIDNLNRIPTR